MKIEQTVLGWLIEPSTSDEEAHLTYLLNALRERYCVPVLTAPQKS